MNELAAIANDLDKLHKSVDEGDNNGEVPQPKSKCKAKFVLVFWVDTKQFNVMALSRIPKEAREEGKLTKVKAEGRAWTVKLLQISGKCYFIYLFSCASI